MTGTLINTAAILIGGLLGLLFGRLLQENLRQTILSGLGLFTLGIAISMFLESIHSLIVLGGLLLGGLIGESLDIHAFLNHWGARLEERFSTSAGQNSKFIQGFVTSSLLFCIGPMAILGAIQDGLVGNTQLLVIKSIMDGFATFAFASTLGVGTLFSAPVVLIYQGSFSLLAAQLHGVMTPGMIAEMTATGGLLLIGLAISSLLEIKAIRVANFLPSLAISPLIVWILTALEFL